MGADRVQFSASPDAIETKARRFVPSRILAMVLYIFYVANFARTLEWFGRNPANQDQFPWIIGLEILFLALFTLRMWRPDSPQWLAHGYFLVQSAILVIIAVMVPGMDFSPALFILLSYQASLAFRGKIRMAWIALFLVLTVGPLMLIYNPLRNLALGLSNMAGILVLAAYLAAAQDEEAICAQNQAMVAVLQETHRKLEEYAGQVEELTAIEERNRLARELHDSVSQTLFSLILNVKATQMLMERNPARLPAQLETLQALAQSALGEMRGLIAQLRPKAE